MITSSSDAEVNSELLMSDKRAARASTILRPRNNRLEGIFMRHLTRECLFAKDTTQSL